MVAVAVPGGASGGMSSDKRQKTAPSAGGGGAPAFSFAFKYDDDEGEAAERPAPKEYGEYDEELYPGVHTCTAVIMADGQALGTAKLLFCERGTSEFFMNCDAVSADLQETSCLLFDSEGLPRHPLVCAHMDGELGEDFLYLDDLDIDAARKELGPLALKALLRTLMELRPWALVAFYRSAPIARSGRARCDDSPAAQAADLALIEENRLHAVRAGLTQVDAGPLYIAAPKHMASPALSREEALAVPERAEPKLKAMSEPNAELFELVRDALSDSTATFDGASVKRIQKLLAQGATLADALALHVCAATGSLESMCLLLRLVPREQGVAAVNTCVAAGLFCPHPRARAPLQASLNAPPRPHTCSTRHTHPYTHCCRAGSADHAGNTPLHLAAEKALGTVSLLAPLPSLGFCTALLAAGASASAANAKGVTPYGQALLAARNASDFKAAFHLPACQARPPTPGRWRRCSCPRRGPRWRTWPVGKKSPQPPPCTDF